MKPTDGKGSYYKRFRAYSLNRMFPPSVLEEDTLSYWRARILFTIIFTGLLISLIAFVPVIAMVIKEQLWGLLVFDGTVWAISIALLLVRGLPYEIRASIILFFIYLVGLVVIVSVGPLSGGPAWLFTFAVLVGVLLGSKAAIVALAINAVTLTIIGWMIGNDLFLDAFPLFKSMEAMITAIANFILLNTIAALSVATLVKGLVSAHTKERDLINNLKTEQFRLIEVKNELESEVEERKQAEVELRESEEKYRNILESIEDGYFEVDIAGNLIFFNDSLSRLIGYSKNELMGMNNRHYTDEVNAKIIYSTFNNVYTSKKPDQGFEWEIIRKDGSKRYVEGSVSLRKDPKGQPIGFRGIVRDITGRKEAEKALRESEEKLARSQKMESLGLLAGGVAHDLNNVLSGIVSYPDLILMDLSENDKLRKPIETMQESGQRAVAIVQDLLTVARGVATTKEPLNLNNIVKGYLQSPEFKKLGQFHPAVKVKTNLEVDLLNLSGSHVHIRKVLMNLVSNAAEAIEGSGNVIVSTTNRYMDRPVRGYDYVKVGEYAVLSVSDDGSGISSDDLERIFEPFYTKKVMGRSGTGLGLAVVWNTVQDHNGYIDVSSNENGTTFEVYFPITREELASKNLSVSVKDLKGNGETILVVDDVKSQRDISGKMLDTLGYNTKSASGGEEAIEYLQQHEVDLVLLDMIMDPGINGRKTYEKIIKIYPDQKAIIVSGFAETDDVKEAQKLGAGMYLKKPLTIEKIGRAVKQELGI